MANWQTPRRRALNPIPRVIDNTEEMAIKQRALDEKHKPVRTSDMPSGPGSFAPRGTTKFLKSDGSITP